jgi:hypothetical protein
MLCQSLLMRRHSCHALRSCLQDNKKCFCSQLEHQRISPACDGHRVLPVINVADECHGPGHCRQVVVHPGCGLAEGISIVSGAETGIVQAGVQAQQLGAEPHPWHDWAVAKEASI